MNMKTQETNDGAGNYAPLTPDQIVERVFPMDRCSEASESVESLRESIVREIDAARQSAAEDETARERLSRITVSAALRLISHFAFRAKSQD